MFLFLRVSYEPKIVLEMPKLVAQIASGMLRAGLGISSVRKRCQRSNWKLEEDEASQAPFAVTHTHTHTWPMA